MTSEEVARRQIRAHTETGSVQFYVYMFTEPRHLIPSISASEAFNLLVSGLQPRLRQMVDTLVPKDGLESAVSLAKVYWPIHLDGMSPLMELERRANGVSDGRSEARFSVSNRIKTNHQGQRKGRKRSISQEEKPKIRVAHPLTAKGPEKADNVG